MLRQDLMEKMARINQMRLLWELIEAKHRQHDKSTNTFLASRDLGPISPEEYQTIAQELKSRRLNRKVPEEHPKRTKILEILEAGTAIFSLSSHVELREWTSEEVTSPRRGHLALIHSTENRRLVFFPDNPEEDVEKVYFHYMIGYIVSFLDHMVLPLNIGGILTASFPNIAEATKFATSIVDNSFGRDSLVHFKGKYVLEQLNKSTFFQSNEADTSLAKHVLRQIENLGPSGLSDEFPSIAENCPIQWFGDWAEDLYKCMRYIEWKYSRVAVVKDELESLDPTNLLLDAELLYRIVPFCSCEEPTHPSVDSLMERIISVKSSHFLINLHGKLHPIVKTCYEELSQFGLEIRSLLPGFNENAVKKEKHLETLEVPKEFEPKYSKVVGNAKILKERLRIFCGRQKIADLGWNKIRFMADKIITNTMLYVIEDIFNLTKKAVEGALQLDDFKTFDVLDSKMRAGEETYLQRRVHQLLSKLSNLKIEERSQDSLAKFCLGCEVHGVDDEVGVRFVDSLTGRRSTSFTKIADQLAVFDINLDFVKETVELYATNILHLLDLDEDLWKLCSKAVLELKQFIVAGEMADEPISLTRSQFDLGTFSKVFDNHFVEDSREVLGDGSYGDVELIRHTDWGLVTLKRFKNNSGFLAELNTVKELSQKNHDIVRVRGFYYPDESHGIPKGYIMETGIITLHDLIHKKHPGVDQYKFLLDIPTACRLIEHLAAIFSDIHELGWIHRDIKPQNILLDEGGRPVICDFGLTHKKTELPEDSKGTLLYKAPELFNRSDQSLGVDEKVDVFAFGIMIWEITHRRAPYSDKLFTDLEEHEFQDDVVSGRRMKIEVEDEFLKDLIEKCWNNDPEERPSMRETEASLQQKRTIPLFDR